MAGKNPDYAIQDLYDAIEQGDPPSWTLFLQIMTLEQAKNYPDNPFDITKVRIPSWKNMLKVGANTLEQLQWTLGLRERT